MPGSLRRRTDNDRKGFGECFSYRLTATGSQNIFGQGSHPLAIVKGDGRERWDAQLGKRDVVTSDHRNRLWNLDACVGASCQDCKGHFVVIAAHTKGWRLLCEQMHDGFSRTCAGG